MLIVPEALPPDIPLAMTESETAAAAIITAGHSAVVATPGGQPSVNCIAEVQKMATGRTVVLFPDPDEVGDVRRRRLGGALLQPGCRVLLAPPVNCDIDQRLRREAPGKSGPVGHPEDGGLVRLELKAPSARGRGAHPLDRGRGPGKGQYLPDDLDRLRMSVSRIRAATAHV